MREVWRSSQTRGWGTETGRSQDERAERHPEAGPGWRPQHGVACGGMGWAQGLPTQRLGLSQPLPSERPWPDESSSTPTPSTRQPLTQLITGLAAGTAGFVVVFPGQKGALRTGEAGGRATRLCAGGLQVVPCGTQCGQSKGASTCPSPHLWLHFQPPLPSFLACLLPLPSPT